MKHLAFTLHYCVVFCFVRSTCYGIIPYGVVSYIASVYDSATSDRVLLNMIDVGSLSELSGEGDQIMSDRYFILNLKHSHLIPIHPPFLEGIIQLSLGEVIYTRIITRHRIPIER
jgi:hypothetical protein